MSSLADAVADRLRAVAGIDPELRDATRPEFGHFQSNVALRLAKAQGRPPRDVAAEIVEALDLTGLCEPPEIAGPGFVNLRLTPQAIAAAVTAQLDLPHAGIRPALRPETVVIDYSAPNVAKQMHVGHLRSSIIGDCLRRVLTAVGHTVIAQNHIGDWGTQFGMLVEQVLEEEVDPARLTLPSAEALYTRANARFKADDAFATRARERVVALQSGDAETRAIWQTLIDVSKAGFNAAYDRLDVLLTDADLAGESTYNEDLSGVVADLEASGTAVVDDGALVVFVDAGQPPMIVRKRDGGFGYSATDLAALRRRVGALGATRLVYVVGAPQTHHFDQVFAVARRAGFLPDGVTAQHVAFGQVLGPDGRKFSTREGTAVTLTTLLDAADAQAEPAIALAAIKYADLSTSLTKDYTFDVERMVRTTGDTGPYLQYAHARLHQILARAGEEQDTAVTTLEDPAEQTLALALTRFGDVVEDVAGSLQPHRLCGYLYATAGALTTFYERCPVLKSEGETRASRLALCRLTRDVLATGLGLLGIAAPERM